MCSSSAKKDAKNSTATLTVDSLGAPCSASLKSWLVVARSASARLRLVGHLGWVHQHEARAPSGSPASAWAAGASGDRRPRIRSSGTKRRGVSQECYIITPPPTPATADRNPRSFWYCPLCALTVSLLAAPFFFSVRCLRSTGSGRHTARSGSRSLLWGQRAECAERGVDRHRGQGKLETELLGSVGLFCREAWTQTAPFRALRTGASPAKRAAPLSS